MNPKIVIRNETHNDVCAITEVTIAAFKTLELSNHTEQPGRSGRTTFVKPDVHMPECLLEKLAVGRCRVSLRSTRPTNLKKIDSDYFAEE